MFAFKIEGTNNKFITHTWVLVLCALHNTFFPKMIFNNPLRKSAKLPVCFLCDKKDVTKFFL